MKGFERAVQRNFEGWASFFWDAFMALRINGISGDYVEFGSEGAHTFGLAWEAIDNSGVERHLWAFDSFEGLPPSDDPRDEHPQWTPGWGNGADAFHRAVAAHGIPADRYTAVPGWYDETLPPLGDAGEPRDIALAYVDCNMYSSTVTVLEFLAPRLKHGMIVAFDDYFCWSTTHPSGERVALREFELAHPQWHFEEFARFNWAGKAFVVEDSATLSKALSPRRYRPLPGTMR